MGRKKGKGGGGAGGDGGGGQQPGPSQQKQQPPKQDSQKTQKSQQQQQQARPDAQALGAAVSGLQFGEGRQQPSAGRGPAQPGGMGRGQQPGGGRGESHSPSPGPPAQQTWGPTPQQWGKGGPQQQQGRGQGPPQQQGWGQGPQQQQGRGQGPPQQQGWGQGPQQQQGRGQGPPQQQGWGQGPQQQQGRGQGPPQQQGWGQGPPQQQGRGQGPPQQQGRGQGPQQQQGRGQGPPQQQGWGQGPPQQQGRGQGPPQQQGRGQGPPQQQGRGQGGQQQSWGQGRGGGQGARPGPSQGSERQQGRRGDDQMERKGPRPAEEAFPGEMLTFPQGRKQKDQSKRPGRKLQVETNHLEMTLKNYNIIAYHYDVALNPDKPKFLLRKAVETFCRQQFPNRWPAYDGQKNLFSNGPLFPNHEERTGEVTIMNDESQREKTFTITVKFAKTAAMSELLRYQNIPGMERPSNALLILDVAMRSRLCSELTMAGRGFFKPGGRVVELGSGVEMWFGYFQASTLGWKPYLNVDVAHAGFIVCRTLVEIIRDELRCDPSRELNDMAIDELQNIVKSLRVDFQLPNQASTKRTYRVNGVKGSARQSRFKDDDGREWTVETYFRDIKRCQLQYPHWPCLWIGSREREILIPSELCRITPGQAFRRKYDDRQTATMVRACAVSSDQRKQKILDTMRMANLTQRNPYMEEFGISVAGQFQRLVSRVLDPPALEYSRNKIVTPRRGEWNGESFIQPAASLNNWAIMNLNNRVRENELYSLVDNLCKWGRELGMEISNNPEVTHVNGNKSQDIQKQFEAFKGRNVVIVFVIVQDRGDNYARVKSIAETKVGVLTQCLKSRTLQKLNPSTVCNILLKVNAKLGGINHVLAKVSKPAIFANPVMIVGADVTHPAPGMGDSVPSVAAVTASYDPQALFKYNIVTRIQPKGERIVDMKEIMREQLLFFYEKTKQKPHNIIMFRDGVSEGEIQRVMSFEINDMRAACKSLGDNYEPEITFVVVQKRHHTRLFPLERVEDRKNNNVPAGTVVDTEIVHPFETEYFLVSHASIQGTARPTKYRLVCDDHNFHEDDLEQLTYYLCHMFTRCNRSVSYPAPTYYAHLAAFRVRHYLDQDPIRNMARLDEGEQRRRTMKVELKSRYPMLFV